MMLSKDVLEKNDSDGMHIIYDKWSQIARDAYNSTLESIDCLLYTSDAADE